MIICWPLPRALHLLRSRFFETAGMHGIFASYHELHCLGHLKLALVAAIQRLRLSA